MLQRHLSSRGSSDFFFHIQALTDIHLKSHLEKELEPNSNINQIYALSIVAILILIITCINYINISIARKSSSMKELGVRKMLGQNNTLMFIQNISESFLYVSISFLIAYALYFPSEIVLGSYLNVDIVSLWSNSGSLLTFIVEFLLLVIVSGGYPSLVLNRLSSADILSSVSRSSTALNAKTKGLFSKRSFSLYNSHLQYFLFLQ